MNRAFAPGAGKPVDVWLPEQRHGAVVVVNVGDVTVLVDDTPPPGSEPLELAPGESIPWDADRALTLAVGDLEPTPGAVLVTENTGQSSGARAIAQAILAQGLAVDIAQAISVAGVPAIDRPQVLMPTTSATIPSGQTWLSGALDVSAYATAIVQLAAVGAGTSTPEQVTAELRWLTDDGATIIATDRITLWLAPGGGAQTWCLQAPAWGSRLQLAVTVPATLTTTSVTLGASVVGSFRDRPAGRSVVTSAGAWGGDLTSTARPRMSPAVRVFSVAGIPSGKTWRDAFSPGWPGSQLTINAQTSIALTGAMAFNLLAINDLQQIDAVASWTLPSGTQRWSWTINTPPDTAIGFSLPNTGGVATGSWDVEAVWATTPVGLPGVLLDA